MSYGKLLVVFITAAGGSSATAGIPQGDLIPLVIALDAVGLQADDMVIILSVNWLLDRSDIRFYRFTLFYPCVYICYNYLNWGNMLQLP